MLDIRFKPKKQPPTEARQWVDDERCWGARPNDRQLRELYGSGIITAVHLTADGAPDAEEQERVQASGMAYVACPATRTGLRDQEVKTILQILEGRQDAPFYVYDEDGSMAGVLTLLFKAVPNFWSFQRYLDEAARRGINVDVSPGMRPAVEDYLRRYVRGRR